MTTYVSPAFVYGTGHNAAPSAASVRARFQHIHDCLVGGGLIQTSDTGQLNISGISTAPTSLGYVYGYRIYRFNDSRQASDPLFLKVVFQNGSNSGNIPRLELQTGTGTNGSGTLTGQTSTAALTGGTSTSAYTPSRTIQSYATHSEGYFAFVMGGTNDYSGTSFMSFTVMRTKDSSGAFDGIGNVLSVDGGNGNSRVTNYFTRTASGGFAGASNIHNCLVPGHPASSALVNGDKQLYPHFYADPDIKQMWAQFTVVAAEFTTSATSFTASPMYGQARTFLFTGQVTAPAAEASANTAYRMAILWE